MTQTYQPIAHNDKDFHFVKLHEDYTALCLECTYTKTREGRKSKASPHCKSLILSVLEHWTGYKHEGEPIFMSISQWVTALYRMYSRNVIMDSLEELVGEGLITREGYKKHGGDIYGYHLCIAEVNKRLAILYATRLKSKQTQLKSELGEPQPGLKVNQARLKSKHFLDTNIDSNNIDSERVYSVSADAENATPAPFSSEPSQDEAQPDQPQEAGSHPIATEPPSPEHEKGQNDGTASDHHGRSDHPESGDTHSRLDLQVREKASTSVVASQTKTPSPPPEIPAQKPAPAGRGKKPAKATTQPTLDLPAGPPIMPPETAAWPSAETAVQIVEAKLGKRYRDAARIKEINAAKRMFKDDPELTRAQFVASYDERNDAWWNEHQGILHFHHMVEKDRVHAMLDRIDARQGKQPKQAPPSSPGGSPPLPTGRSAILLSDERQKRNRDRLMAAAAEYDRKEEARRAAAL